MTKAYRIMAPVLSIVLVVTLGAVIMLVGSRAEAPIAVSVGASRNLSPDFLGFQGDGPSTSWGNPAFLPAVKAMAPETIRGIFGGTAANYFNWQTGQYFIASTDPSLSYFKPGQPSPPYSLTNYVNALKAGGADAVFNVNVMTYCPVDNNNPASTDQAGASCTEAQACGPNPSAYTTSCTSTDYTWGLDYQIALLKAAQSMGVPIKYIELGNELYITNNPDYVYYFPSPQAYVNKVNAWIPVLKQDFPGAQIAIIGLHRFGGNNAPEPAWDQTVLSGVHGEDAVTFHTYYGSQIPNGGSVTDPSYLSAMLSRASQSMYSTLQTVDLGYLPQGTTAWITEWNKWSDDLQVESGSWAQGLTEANYAIDLARTPQIELADNHDLVAQQFYGALFASTNGYKTTAEAGKPVGVPSPLPTTQLFGMTGGGFALSDLERSLHGATSTATLNFSDNPPIAGSSVPGLVGQSFTVDGKTNLYFVNMSDQDEMLGLGSLAGYYSVLQYASSPVNFITGDSSIPANNSIATDTVTVPAYSVTSLVSTPPPPSPPSVNSTTITAPSTTSSQSSSGTVTITNQSAPGATTTKAYVKGKLVATGKGNQVSIDPKDLPNLPNGQQTVTLKSSNPGGSISLDGQTIAVHNTFAKQIIASYQNNKWLTVGSIAAVIVLVIVIYVFSGFKWLFSLLKNLTYRFRSQPPTDQGSPPPMIVTPTQPQ